MTRHCSDGPLEHTFKSTGNPWLIYIGTDQKAYILDAEEVPADEREAAILTTLLRMASRTVREVADVRD